MKPACFLMVCLFVLIGFYGTFNIFRSFRYREHRKETRQIRHEIEERKDSWTEETARCAHLAASCCNMVVHRASQWKPFLFSSNGGPASTRGRCVPTSYVNMSAPHPDLISSQLGDRGLISDRVKTKTLKWVLR